MLIDFNNAYIVQALTAGATEIAFYRPVLECGALIVKKTFHRSDSHSVELVPPLCQDDTKMN